MDTHTHTHFRKLQEHGMGLKRLANDEQDDKKKRKNVALKVTNIEDMESEDENCLVRLINSRSLCLVNSKNS